MKRILLLITVLTVLLIPGVNAQNDVAYPVDLNVQIVPPYNTCIRDMAPAGLDNPMGRFRVTLLVRDMHHSYHPFRIRMKVQDMSGREVFSSLSGAYTIPAGSPYLLSSYELLNDLFSHQNIQTGAQYINGCFDEGSYIFTFQVVEGSNPSLPVSREFQCFTFLEKGAPPMLIFPSNRSTVLEGSPVIPFQWQLPYVTNVMEQFILEVYEVPEGTNPNEAFNQPDLKIEEQSTFQTLSLVEQSAGKFESGKQYAWRVTIKDKEAYENQGKSEVYTFIYGTQVGGVDPPVLPVEPTLPKVIIDSVGTSSGNPIVYWRNDTEHFSGYIVEVRRTGSDAAWSNTSAGYEDHSLTLTNIAPKIQYEVRIKGLWQQASETEYGIYSDTLTFQLASPEDIDCGSPLPALNSTTPITEGIAPGFVFQANGQEVEIETVSIDGGSISGTGYMKFPLLKAIKIKVAFNNIQINENKELLSGTVETVYDESTGLIMDLNRLLNKGDGGIADGPVQPLTHQTYPNKDAALANMKEGEFGQIEGNDSMYVKTADNKLVSVGTVLSADFRYENKGKLDENSPYIVFSKPENANLAFDNNSGNYFDNVYRIKDTYEKLNTKYTVPWLAMNPGKTVHLDAKTQGGEIDESTVKFIIPLSGGSTLQLEHTTGFDVQIPGGKAGTTTEIFALAAFDGTNKVVGKLKLANYAAKTKKVNLVPVRRDEATIDGEAIENKLNDIYGRLGITFEVSVKERFGEKNAGDPDDELEILNDGLQVDDKNFWSNETQEMKYLKYLYHEAHANEIDKDAAYIFVIGFAERPEVQGDMPRGKQTGYVFCDTEETFSDGHLIAHELGHGIYGLEHTFATGYGVPQGSTNNLMDYTPDNQDFLASWQWKIIANPMIVWNFLEGDEDAMAMKSIDLFEAISYLRICKHYNIKPTKFLSKGMFSGNFFNSKLEKQISFIWKNDLGLTPDLEFSKSLKYSNVYKYNLYTILMNDIEIINCHSESDRDLIFNFLNSKTNIEAFDKSSLKLDNEEYNYEKIYLGIERLKAKLINENKYDALNSSDMLILNLPLIEWGIKWQYTSIAMYNWLIEGGDINIDKDMKDWIFKWSLIEDKQMEFKNELSKRYGEVVYIAVEEKSNSFRLYALSDVREDIKSEKIKVGDRIVDNQYTNFGGISIGEYENISSLSDYVGTLGSITLKYYYEGVLSSKDTITIEKTGIKISDSFDFIDSEVYSQPLGAWLNNVFYPKIPELLSINPFGDYINLFNSDFNDFRKKTNIGKDFKFLLNTIIPVEGLLKKIVIDDSNNGIIYTKEQ